MTPTRDRVPARLRPGSRVGIAALSGPVDERRLTRGIAELRGLGFEPVAAANLGRREGFLAGSDDERLEGFHSLLEDDGVEAVVFARGGHGVLRILDGIDWDLLARRPRWFVGYSDLTPFLNEVCRRTGWMTLHGPMVASDLGRDIDPAELATFRGALAGDYDATFDGLPIGLPWPEEGVRSVLRGGCLAMVCATLGTFAAPAGSLDGALVFLEDVGESAYRIDRMLCQLGLAGLDRAAGVVWGYLHEDPEQVDRAEEATRLAEGVEEVLRDQSERLGVPFLYGIPAGHGRPNHTLPLGAEAHVAGGRLRVSMPPTGR